MINIKNIGENLISLYGTEGAELMLLQNVQDNKIIEVPLVDVSDVPRYGTFIFSYDSECELNSAYIYYGKTYYNLLAGQYNYTIGEDICGILKIESEKEQNKVYEQENTSKVYNG